MSKKVCSWLKNKKIGVFFPNFTLFIRTWWSSWLGWRRLLLPWPPPRSRAGGGRCRCCCCRCCCWWSRCPSCWPGWSIRARPPGRQSPPGKKINICCIFFLWKVECSSLRNLFRDSCFCFHSAKIFWSWTYIPGCFGSCCSRARNKSAPSSLADLVFLSRIHLNYRNCNYCTNARPLPCSVGGELRFFFGGEGDFHIAFSSFLFFPFSPPPVAGKREEEEEEEEGSKCR